MEEASIQAQSPPKGSVPMHKATGCDIEEQNRQKYQFYRLNTKGEREGSWHTRNKKDLVESEFNSPPGLPLPPIPCMLPDSLACPLSFTGGGGLL